MTLPAAALRNLIAAAEPTLAPDCYSALTARIVERAGFPAGYVGGQSIATMHYAVPDYGCLTTTEMITQVTAVCAAVGIPIVVDADEAGGSVAEIHRTIRGYERAGVAGVHLEDEQVPKHSAWHGGLVPLAEMQARLAAASGARTDADFVIMARSNELQNRSWHPPDGGELREMIRRGCAYAEAGADLFVANGARGDELDRIVREVPIPIVTYRLSRDEARRRGIALVLYSGWAAAEAGRIQQRWLQRLMDDGELPAEVAEPLADRDALVGESEYGEVVRAWAKSTGRASVDRLPGPAQPGLARVSTACAERSSSGINREGG